ncbi:LmeA family phospholipid-binding protein [Mycolicibacterium thermoresistibile]
MTDPWARPPHETSVPPQSPTGPGPSAPSGPDPSAPSGPPPAPQGGYPPPPPPGSAQGPAPGFGGPPPGQPGEPSNSGEPDNSLLAKVKNLFSDPLSIVLVVVIVIALVAAGVLAGELYARNRADTVVARVVSCVVQDEATASFDPLPPFLIQHMSGHYTNINIETAGNQIRDAKGMKLALHIRDVRLEDTPDSGGSLGALDITIDWSSDGIRQTVQEAMPLIGSFVTTGVNTDPAAGTIELEGPLASIVARPQVVNGGIRLEVVSLTGLGVLTLPRETVQPILDAFTDGLTEDYPMDITAQSVQVTDTGVIAQLASRDASIPKGQEDPCFAEL